MEEAENTCLDCGKTLFGRIDKNFATIPAETRITTNSIGFQTITCGKSIEF